MQESDGWVVGQAAHGAHRRRMPTALHELDAPVAALPALTPLVCCCPARADCPCLAVLPALTPLVCCYASCPAEKRVPVQPGAVAVWAGAQHPQGARPRSGSVLLRLSCCAIKVNPSCLGGSSTSPRCAPAWMLRPANRPMPRGQRGVGMQAAATRACRRQACSSSTPGRAWHTRSGLLLMRRPVPNGLLQGPERKAAILRVATQQLLECLERCHAVGECMPVSALCLDSKVCCALLECLERCHAVGE